MCALVDHLQARTPVLNCGNSLSLVWHEIETGFFQMFSLDGFFGSAETSAYKGLTLLSSSSPQLRRHLQVQTSLPILHHLFIMTDVSQTPPSTSGTQATDQ